MMKYIASTERYNSMQYRRAGKSGLLLPAISLGLWHNFSDTAPLESSKEMIFAAFDSGITYFDLANNYGPPAGSAESTFGKILSSDLSTYRDELIVSTKAGHEMWQGPYGDWGSRKSLIASIDQSLRRLNMEYVDIFYSHRYDPNTPLEETMLALDQIVKSGKALYVSLSKYPPDKLREALTILKELRTPVLVHQVRYSMLCRDVENEVFAVQEENNMGCVTFSPLAQGLLSNKYLGNTIPENSRAALNHFLKGEDIKKSIDKVKALNAIALERGQSLSQMAVAWQLQNSHITSVIVGISSKSQLYDNLGALDNSTFSPEELEKIDKITR